MKYREDFLLTTRRGRRARRRSLVVHYLPPVSGEGDAGAAAMVGFVVGRTVGRAVDRNRVVRRLRHLVRERLPLLPDGSRTVVRALPPATGLRSRDLEHDLDGALERVLGGAP